MFLSKANRNAKTSSRGFESRLQGFEQLEHKQLFASLTGDAVDTADHTEDQREPLATTWGVRYIGSTAEYTYDAVGNIVSTTDPSSDEELTNDELELVASDRLSGDSRVSTTRTYQLFDDGTNGS